MTNKMKDIDIINDIETKLPVTKWKIDNIHVWPIIRIELSFILSRITGVLETKKESDSFINKVRKLSNRVVSQFQANIIDSKHNDAWTKDHRVVFLNHTICRSFNSPEGYYDVFCDPFIELFQELDVNCIVLEFTPGGQYRIPRYGKSIFVQNSFERYSIQSKLFYKTKTYDINFDINILNDYLVQKDLGEIKFSLDRLCMTIYFLMKLKHNFQRLFKQSNPSLAFVVYYYGIYGMAFNLACREMGIPTVDIQHGVQGELHAAYGRWLEVPQEGYNLLPDVFWCWSNTEYEAIEQWSKNLDKHRAIVGGNLWINKWQSSGWTQHYDQIIKSYEIDTYTRNILYTLQTGIKIPDFVLQAVRNSPDDWQWWFRLHPGMWSEKDRIRELLLPLHKNIIIEEATSLPLLALLRFMDIHITCSSSVVIEASQMGVFSVIVDALGIEYYRENIAQQKAVKCTNRDQLIQLICETKSNHEICTSTTSSNEAKKIIMSLMK